MISVSAVCITLILLSIVTLFVSLIMLEEYNWRAKFWLPIYIVLISGWCWVITFNISEPSFTHEEVIRDIKEEINDKDQKVQWFFNFSDGIQRLDGVYEDIENRKVIGTKYSELPRYGMFKRSNTHYEYKVIEKNK
jgi:hypothetical protein